MIDFLYLDTPLAIDLLCHAADRVAESRQYLCDIDALSGDGDHGIGMTKGMQKAKTVISGMRNISNVFDIFKEFGKAMIMTMGGASGIIFGSLFMSGAADMPAREKVSSCDFAVMMEKSLSVIKERGKAEPGDKTMIDALSPAVTAMKDNAPEGYAKMLYVAAAAAEKGMEATKNMIAKKGRSKSLAERSLGHPDAGAVSVYLIFLSMSEFIGSLKNNG